MDYKVGDSLTVEFSFKGQKEEDLACKVGDKLKVMKILQGDPNWVCCTNSKKEQGLVPINHVKVISALKLNQPWFHGGITRREAIDRLKDSNDGEFLVRTSDKYPGDFTLCVRFESDVQFYHVMKSHDEYSLDEESWFKTMPQLIWHYQEDADGLCCQLDKNYTESINSLEASGYIIPEAQLHKGPKIGCGEFSEVFRGNYNDLLVAIKSFKKSPQVENLFAYESSLMAKLKHKNLVAFIGISYVTDYVFIITEYMENGNLVNYLRSRGRSVIRHNEQIKFAIGACSGMTYLEEHCLVHRDLAARNILLDRDLGAKVSDFGLAKYDHNRLRTLSSSGGGKEENGGRATRDLPSPSGRDPSEDSHPTSNSTNRIPVKWTAPEALSDNKYTTKSDVWSFGILLWEIFSFGRTPYPRIYANDVKTHLLRGYRMEPPEDTPATMYDLMRLCWSLESDKRPSFVRILELLHRNLRDLPTTGPIPPPLPPQTEAPGGGGPNNEYDCIINL